MAGPTARVSNARHVELRDHRRGGVGRAVVDDQDLEVVIVLAANGPEASHERIRALCAGMMTEMVPRTMIDPMAAPHDRQPASTAMFVGGRPPTTPPSGMGGPRSPLPARIGHCRPAISGVRYPLVQRPPWRRSGSSAGPVQPLGQERGPTPRPEQSRSWSPPSRSTCISTPLSIQPRS